MHYTNARKKASHVFDVNELASDESSASDGETTSEDDEDILKHVGSNILNDAFFATHDEEDTEWLATKYLKKAGGRSDDLCSDEGEGSKGDNGSEDFDFVLHNTTNPSDKAATTMTILKDAGAETDR